MDDIKRTGATLDLLALCVDESWRDFLDAIERSGEHVVNVSTWSLAVRHLVAYARVRHVLIGADMGLPLERMVARIVAMQPGVHVFAVEALHEPGLPPWIRKVPRAPAEAVALFRAMP